MIIRVESKHGARGPVFLHRLAEWTGPTVKTAVFPLCGSGWQHENTKKTDTANATTMASNLLGPIISKPLIIMPVC